MSTLIWRDIWMLLSILPIVAVVGWWWRIAVTRRERILHLIRGMALLSLIFALAAPSIGVYAEHVALVVVRDRSASMNVSLATQDAMLNQLLADKPDDALLGIVDVGADVQVARIARSDGDDISPAMLMNRNATALADGITQAAALIPAGYIPRILVLSDGLETHGRVIERVESLRARGVRIDVVPMESQVVLPVAALRQISAPQQSQGQGDLMMTVDLESSVAQPAQIIVRNQVGVLLRQSVALTGQAQQLLLPITNLSPGWHRIEVVLKADQDDALPDNQRVLLVQRQGAPRVLVLADPLEQATPLYQAIQATGSDVTLVRPRDASGRLTDMISYDIIVLADTNATVVPESVMQSIATAVEVHGRGFLWVGGFQSLGAGGFRRTPLHDIAAVSLDPINPATQKRLTMYLVIDRSGSMDERSLGMSRLDMAKEAAYQALTDLNPTDNVGVVFFDDSAVWALSPQPLPSSADIATALGRFSPGGGTSIRAGLELAHSARTAVEGDTHHVILLSDGVDASNSDDIARAIAQSDATLSTIALGDQAGVATLARLASLGGGVDYVVANAQDLPQIFMNETARVSGRDFVEDDVIPQIVDPDAMPVGLSALPILRGYNRTALLPDTRVFLQIDDDTPLWAVRLVGRGQSAVWASDMGTRWGADWVANGYVRQIMPALLAPLLPQPADNLAVSWQWYDDILEVDVALRDAVDDVPQITLTDASGQQINLLVEQRNAQRWVTRMPDIPSGEYVLSVQAGGQQIVRGVVIDGRSELRNDGQGLATLTQLAAQTGGRIYDAVDASLWEATNASSLRRQELAPWLILWAMMLYVIEIALRRLPVQQLWRARVSSAQLSTPVLGGDPPPQSPPPTPPVPPSRLQRLQKAKRKALD